jgi:hypothetical protein
MPKQAGSDTFEFSSYGVNIHISSREPDLLEWAVGVARRALIGRIEPIVGGIPFASVFVLSYDDGAQIKILQNGEVVGLDSVREHLHKFFNSLIRVAVAEHAPANLFMHAGAVAIQGKGIIFPGTSFIGKSTLVAELVRQEAEYYSDDYAVFDSHGLLHPFPRILSMRAPDEKHTPYDIEPEKLGRVGNGSVSVALICLTEYVVETEWLPNELARGEGALRMVPFTFGFIQRPEFSMNILKNVASNAIILSGTRGSADKFAETLLEFVDKLTV